MAPLHPKSADYIIVGGGISGVVLASRLSQADHSVSVLLIEAGPDHTGNPLTSTPLACFGAHYSPLDYAYHSTPQKHLNNRSVYGSAAKVLSGGSAINYGTWVRGPAIDYDDWAEEVGSKEWGYAGLLPYLKKVEGCVRDGADPEQHGFDGPVEIASISQSGRKYPLDEAIASAWNEIGVTKVDDGNGGTPLGISESVESFGVDGRRQPTSSIYDMSRVTVLTNSTVHRVLLSQDEAGEATATGIQLASGDIITANREVILSAGATHTPQLLLLSGIGPMEDLARHNITQIVDSPEVGKNFWDHPAMCMWWQLREPEKGLALGSSSETWNNPDNHYDRGLPSRYMVFDHVPSQNLLPALTTDGQGPNHGILQIDRVHTETFLCYAPAQAQLNDVPVPFDGGYMTSVLINIAPTSRGSISLSSADPNAPPVVDPSFCSTEADKAIFRHGIRKVLKLLLGTKDGKRIVEKEFPPPGFSALTLEATDEDIDLRMRRVACSFFHVAGSVSMGKVVDINLKVKGVKGLRVCDASILPVGMAAHLQACVYAIAEKGADIILDER